MTEDRMAGDRRDLVERLRCFEKYELEVGDTYGAEVLHHAAARIVELEAGARPVPEPSEAARTGPWIMEADEHGETRRGWRFQERDTHSDEAIEEGHTHRDFWLDRDDFTEVEARAILNALNRAAGDAGAPHPEPEEGPTARFERIAAEFYRDMGYLAPGKSVPIEMASESYERERQEAWRQWRAKRGGTP